MSKFNVGDIVIQNDEFWFGPKFKGMVVKVEPCYQRGEIVFIDNEVIYIDNAYNIEKRITSFHCCFLKLDQQYIRKNKLLKMYEQI